MHNRTCEECAVSVAAHEYGYTIVGQKYREPCTLPTASTQCVGTLSTRSECVSSWYGSRTSDASLNTIPNFLRTNDDA
jgi:hypothetical protein